jgi:uncharacterized protein YdaU (DUF1376 family)
MDISAEADYQKYKQYILKDDHINSIDTITLAELKVRTKAFNETFKELSADLKKIWSLRLEEEVKTAKAKVAEDRKAAKAAKAAEKEKAKADSESASASSDGPASTSGSPMEGVTASKPTSTTPAAATKTSKPKTAAKSKLNDEVKEVIRGVKLSISLGDLGQLIKDLEL